MQQPKNETINNNKQQTKHLNNNKNESPQTDVWNAGVIVL